jgi:hypothetical protein
MAMAPKYPFDRMKAGHCFTVSADKALSARPAVSSYAKKTGKVFRANRVRNEPMTIYRLNDDGTEPLFFIEIKWTV